MTKTYLLRTCTATGQCCDDPNAAGSRHHPFIWPESGPVEASDWTPEPKCGGGLHGLIDGQGAVDLLSTAPDARWLVVECDPADVVQIDPSKGKAKRGTVIYCGAKDGAIALLQFILPGQPIVYGTATAGDDGTATAGYAGIATAGDDGTATAGDDGTATAGDDGTATAGARGTATAGARGIATAGYAGTATAGARGIATAGARGIATAGDDGTATAGDDGTATAGYAGILSLRWYDGHRYRIATFYVGEDGIEPGVPYRCEAGKAVRVEKEKP